MKVVVLAGGASNERDVSLRSGRAIAEALQSTGHEVEVLDTYPNLKDILPALKKADVIFLGLHGVGGEDGTLQTYLEDNGIYHYTGSGIEASKICFYKNDYALLLEKNKIITPRSETVDSKTFIKSIITNGPFVLKPNNGGSSIDTFIVRDFTNPPNEKIQTALMKYGEMLVQDLIEGQEITVPILCDTALPVIEIIAPSGQEFDYENKYNGATLELCPPKNISHKLQIKAQELAKEIHMLTGCRDISRTDMIVTSEEELFVLETNTLPGMTNESTVPKAAKAVGMSMGDLCSNLAQKAGERRA